MKMAEVPKDFLRQHKQQRRDQKWSHLQTHFTPSLHGRRSLCHIRLEPEHSPILAFELAHNAIERVGVKSMNAAATDDTRPGATRVRIRPQMASIDRMGLILNGSRWIHSCWQTMRLSYHFNNSPCTARVPTPIFCKLGAPICPNQPA